MSRLGAQGAKGGRQGRRKGKLGIGMGIGSDRHGMGRVTKTCREKAGDLVPDTGGEDSHLGLTASWGAEKSPKTRPQKS